MKKNEKKLTVITATAGFVLIAIGISYAFITSVITGEKNIVINAGVLDLVLEEENEIMLENALPMYDEVGMIQDEVFNFKLINNTSNNTNYKIMLNKISTSNELSTDIVKYYLTKDGIGTPKLLSTIGNDNVIDEDAIGGNKTINYSLRLWIDSRITDNSITKGKILSYKISVEVAQEINKTINEEIIKQVDTSTEINFNDISSDTNGNGVYKYTENDTEIYYYRGNVDNNHVIFGGYCWEIVRTTSTKGIRLIYDGISNGGKCNNTGEDSQISTSAFNKKYNDNAYVGYMYGLTGLTNELSNPQCIKLNSSGTYAEVGNEQSKEDCEASGGKWATNAYEATHANVVNSDIKNVIDEWFASSTLNTKENLEKIEDAVYCNDRSIDVNSHTALGYGTNATAYMVRNRLGINKNPTLDCANENDRFTVSNENGNGALTYPVGLITSDEMALAGEKYGTTNNNSYLTTGNYYWSMSPSIFFNYASLMNVYSAGSIEYDGAYAKYGVRPVITLNSTVMFEQGDGSSSSPFIVK